MTKIRTGGPEEQGGNGDGRDIQVAITSLDPGTTDPDFWDRFRLRIVSRAAAELARRRAEGATVNEILQKWSKTLVPLAAAAAAAALVIIWRGPSADAPLTMEIEEALTWDLDDEVLPTLIGNEGAGEASAFIFAAETF